MDIFTLELEAVLAEAGCPLCRADGIDQRHWMQTFIREGHRDTGVRRRFLASGGFCAAHADLFLEMARGQEKLVVIGLVYRSLVEENLSRLQALTKPRRGRRSKSPLWQGTCPACLERERSAERKSYFFCEVLVGGASRERYARSNGLCAGHLATVLEQAAERKMPRVYEFLLNDWIERLTLLRSGLSEFDRKRDYRFKHEPRGEEQQAPIEALRRYSGSGGATSSSESG